MVRTLPRGIYAPLPCFFYEDNEELDLVSFKKHVKYTAKAGTVPVVSGSMGEAAHLTPEERIEIIKATRSALDEEGLFSTPIIAGVGAASTRETIRLAKQAADAGADSVIVVAPGYYAGILSSKPAALKKYFLDVAEACPIPVMMYNFPATSAGINLSSDLIEDIAKSGPNLCGIKLTCAEVGKMTRIAATVVTDSGFATKYPRVAPTKEFILINGVIDYMLASMACGSSGAISGLTLLAPRVCVRLWELCNDPSRLTEAQRLQGLVSHADGAIFSAGVPGMKWMLARLYGYGSTPRRPLLPMSDESGEAMFSNEYLQEVLAMERDLLERGE